MLCTLEINWKGTPHSSSGHWGSNPQRRRWTIGRHMYHPWLYTCIHLGAATGNNYRPSAVKHFLVASPLCSLLSCPSSRWIYQDKNAVHIHNLFLFATKYLLEFRNAPCGTRISLCFSHWIHGTACLVLVQELELHSRIHLCANKLFLYKCIHSITIKCIFFSRINMITACHYISIGRTVLLQRSQSLLRVKLIMETKYEISLSWLFSLLC